MFHGESTDLKAFHFLAVLMEGGLKLNSGAGLRVTPWALLIAVTHAENTDCHWSHWSKPACCLINDPKDELFGISPLMFMVLLPSTVCCHFSLLLLVFSPYQVLY